MALVLALLALALVEAMTAGLLVLATQARSVTASELRSRRADNTAEAAVQGVLAGWQRGAFDTLPAGAIVSVPAGPAAPDVSARLTVERLAGATYLVRAQVRVGGGHAFSLARAAAFGRTLDRARLLAESNQALAVGGPALIGNGARLSVADSVCPSAGPLPPAAALRSAGAHLFDASASVAGPIELDSTLAPGDSLALGGVKWSQLADIADRVETGPLTPAPALRDGACDPSAAGNWGDPSDPAGACRGYLPLIFAPGDLYVAGGLGQGILVVRGTLTLSGGHFAGYIVAGQGLTLEAGASVSGAVASKGGLALVDNATIVYERCAVARPAWAAPGTKRLITERRRFIPAF